jgi:hypothetical protein
MSQFLDHLVDDLLPALIEKLSQTKPGLRSHYLLKDLGKARHTSPDAHQSLCLFYGAYFST